MVANSACNSKLKGIFLMESNTSKTIKLGSGYSDVSLGICAKELNIGFINHDGFKSQTPNFYKVEKTLIKDIYTFHYIKPDLMNEMYLILQQ
jgi:hypothetical protein